MFVKYVSEIRKTVEAVKEMLVAEGFEEIADDSMRVGLEKGKEFSFSLNSSANICLGKGHVVHLNLDFGNGDDKTFKGYRISLNSNYIKGAEDGLEYPNRFVGGSGEMYWKSKMDSLKKDLKQALDKSNKKLTYSFRSKHDKLVITVLDYDGDW